jgi:TonB-linked SusC/RagA family outer membrane protein
LAGYEYYYAYYERLRASRDQYDLNSFPYLNLGPLEFRDNEGNAWENAYRSFFGRFMYNYMSKYLIQANIRFDASSRFHEDYRWGSFPSFSLGWVVSEESFMESLNFLSFLKLRGSWGSLGNERIGNYPYQATIGFNNALFYQGNNVIAAQTAAQSAYAIENISWETTESYNIGLDANFLDNRLRFTGDYFQKETKDMLLALEIPDFMGFENPDQNTGVMETTGWEANISWNNSVGELGYSVSFNISDFESVMGNLGGTEFLGDKIKIEGSEFDEWYGYRTDGLFQTQEEVENSAVLNNKTSPGDVKYVDISGPDGVPDGIISPEYDRVLLGGSLPRMMYGGNVRLDYKGFDFSVVIQGVGKQNARLTRYMVMPFREGWGNVPAILENNYWSRYNSNEKNENVKYPRLTRAAQGNNYSMSDYWLFNGRYIRLKNLTLGYRLPQTLTQKINMKGIRIYVSVSDFFTLNKYPEGWDPEVRESDYPMTTTAIAGLSVDF